MNFRNKIKSIGINPSINNKTFLFNIGNTQQISYIQNINKNNLIEININDNKNEVEDFFKSIKEEMKLRDNESNIPFNIYINATFLENSFLDKYPQLTNITKELLLKGRKYRITLCIGRVRATNLFLKIYEGNYLE